MKFAIHDRQGRITQICMAPTSAGLDQITPPDHAFCEVADDVSDGSHYIFDDKAIKMPDRPSRHHSFDYGRRAWVDMRSDAGLAREARSLRDARIAATDWVMLPDISMAEPVKAQWMAYRAALRNVPAQPGFPRSITWPAKPF